MLRRQSRPISSRGRWSSLKEKESHPDLGLLAEEFFCMYFFDLTSHLGKTKLYHNFSSLVFLYIKIFNFGISYFSSCESMTLQLRCKERKTYRERLKYKAWRWMSSGSISTGFITASWSIDHLNFPGVLTKESELMSKSKLTNFNLKNKDNDY